MHALDNISATPKHESIQAAQVDLNETLLNELGAFAHNQRLHSLSEREILAIRQQAETEQEIGGLDDLTLLAAMGLLAASS